MIRADQNPQAHLALRRLIVHAKSLAYDADGNSLAELLNDIEMLPEFLKDERDRTDEFIEMLHSIAQVHPTCRYIVEEFERASIGVS